MKFLARTRYPNMEANNHSTRRRVNEFPLDSEETNRSVHFIKKKKKQCLQFKISPNTLEMHLYDFISQKVVLLSPRNIVIITFGNETKVLLNSPLGFKILFKDISCYIVL